jgi:hypothetical protein
MPHALPRTLLLYSVLLYSVLQAGLEVGIVSPDKDFLQLLRPGLQLLRMPVGTLGKGKYLGPPYTHLDFVKVGTAGLVMWGWYCRVGTAGLVLRGWYCGQRLCWCCGGYAVPLVVCFPFVSTLVHAHVTLH